MYVPFELEMPGDLAGALHALAGGDAEDRSHRGGHQT